jgi:hypothetical protein
VIRLGREHEDTHEYLLVVLILLTGVALLGGYSFRQIRSEMIAFEYAIWAEYSSMPESDEAVEEWLSDQPGVGNHNVCRYGQVVSIHFVIEQDHTGTNPRPLI